MSDLAESLLTAFQAYDASKFAALAERLHHSVTDRRETAKRLVEIVCEADVRRAERAVMVMSITGMASEQEWYEELVQAAEKIFTPQVLSELVDEEQQRAQKAKRAFAPRMRLLQGVVHALARKSQPRAVALLDNIENYLTGTSLQPYVSKWRKSEG